MATTLGEFGKTAQRLARNPLGIIALFIVLVYGIAGLVLGYSAAKLEAHEKLPLIWFLVLFPVIVLGVFMRLVTHHHAKLYAPHDFPDKEGFFRAMTPSEQKARLDAEIESIEAETVAVPHHGTAAVEMEGAGIARAVSIRHAYVLAEELAFRELEREFGAPVQRNVAVGRDVGFDGILVQEGKSIAIEIKFTRQPSWNRLVESTLPRLARVVETLESVSRMLLVVVTEGLSAQQREVAASRAAEGLRASSPLIDLRVYDFGELMERYGIAGHDT